MSGSIIAGEIDREYRARKFCERRKQIQKCKNKSCKECRCTEGGKDGEKMD